MSAVFYPYHPANAASPKVTKYEINGQLSVYLPLKSNARQSNIEYYANIMLIKETASKRATAKTTLTESGFKPIHKQAMPFKLSYSGISKHSKNTVDSTLHYDIHVVIAASENGNPVIATMTTPVIINQNYSDLGLTFQLLAEPIE